MRVGRISVTTLLFLLACIGVYLLSRQQITGLWTRDGRVRADVVTLAGEVNGYITRVAVADNQRVAKGQLLFVVDDRDYRLLADESREKMNASQADMLRLEAMYHRRQHLSSRVLSREEVDNAESEYLTARANYAADRQATDKALLDLSKTRIYAPAAGYITNLQVHAGDYLTVGNHLVSLVKANSFYVYAYFQETQLSAIQHGQRAKITLLDDAVKLNGRVESIARGITDYSNKATTGGLHDVDPTFEWVRLPMRIPVRIGIPLTDKNYAKLVSGMTCTVQLEP